MKEIKSKRSGRIEIISDEVYANMVKKAPDGFMNRFTVTDLRERAIISKTPIKTIIKPTKNKNNDG